MVAIALQQRMEASRARLQAGRSQAAQLLEEHKATPAREIPAFSFANSVQGDTGVSQRLESVMRSLSAKTTAEEPEPQLADTGQLSPSPKGLPNQPLPRAKTTELT